MMKKVKILPLLLLWLTIMPCQSAFALRMPCYSPREDGNAIERHEVIFKGKVAENFGVSFFGYFLMLVGKEPGIYTRFEVLEVYKGEPGEKAVARLLNVSEARGRGNFTVGEEVTVFARRDDVQGDLTIDTLCSPAIRDKNGNRDDNEQLTTLLRGLHTKTQRLDEQLGKRFDQRLFSQKIALLGKFRDYEKLKTAYEAALSTQTPASSPAEGADTCSGVFGWREGLPSFLKTGAADSGMLLGYGRVLFSLKQYTAALRPLCLVRAKDSERKIDASQLLTQALQKGKIDAGDALPPDFTNAKLSKESFRGRNLRGVSFRGASLSQIDFNGANLSGADFSGAKIDGDMMGANFSGALFRSAEIEVRLQNVNFSGADFTGGRLTTHQIGNADFSKANFTDAAIYLGGGFSGGFSMGFASRERAPRNLDFTGVNFTGALVQGLSGAITTGAVFTRATFWDKRSRYSGADNTGLDLSNANLAGFETREGQADKVNFENSDLTDAAFHGTSLKGANFRGANLAGAVFGAGGIYLTDLSGADLSTAKLETAAFEGAHFDSATKFPPGFEPLKKGMVMFDTSNPHPIDISADQYLIPPKHYRLMQRGFITRGGTNLSGSSFDGLMGLRFEQSVLRNASFKRLKSGPTFWDVDLTGADFSYADLDGMITSVNNKPPAKLAGANFRCAGISYFMGESPDIDKAMWEGAIFRNANFSKWKFSFNPIVKKVIFARMGTLIDQYGPADYSNMDLALCNLTAIDFATTKLAGANFKGATLIRANLTKADVTGANFKGAIIAHDTKLPPELRAKGGFIYAVYQTGGTAPWQASSMKGGIPATPADAADLPLPDLSHDNFDYVLWDAAWMPGVNLRGTSLRFATFSATNLMKADFREADLTGAVLQDAFAEGADFTGANLTGADLRQTRLEGALFDGAILKNALYDNATVWPTGFDPVGAGAYLVTDKK